MKEDTSGFTYTFHLNYFCTNYLMEGKTGKTSTLISIYPMIPTKTRFYVLKNGFTVIMSVNKDEPRLQTIIATKAGSNNDPDTHTGLGII